MSVSPNPLEAQDNQAEPVSLRTGSTGFQVLIPMQARGRAEAGQQRIT